MQKIAPRLLFITQEGVYDMNDSNAKTMYETVPVFILFQIREKESSKNLSSSWQRIKDATRIWSFTIISKKSRLSS